MSDLPAGEPTIAGAAWRYRIVVVFALLLALAPAVAYAVKNPVQYTATGSLVLEDPSAGQVFSSPNGTADRYVSDQIALLKSWSVDTAASQAAAHQVPPRPLPAEYFFKQVTVSGSQRDGNYVQVSVIDANSAAALAAVDAVVTGYEGIVQAGFNAQVASALAQIDTATKPVDAELAVVQGQLAAVEGQLQAVANRPPNPVQYTANGNVIPQQATPIQEGLLGQQQELLGQQQALLARRATLADKRDQVTLGAARQTPGVSTYLKIAVPNSRLITALPILALATVAGLLLGVGYAYSLAWRRRVFSRSGDPEGVVGVPLIAEVPRLPSGSAVGVFHTLGLVVRTLRSAGGSRMIAITSRQRQQGRSTIAGHLALSLVADGMRVLVTEGDAGHRGIADLLTERFGTSPVDGALRDSAPPGASVERVSLESGTAGELFLLRPTRDHSMVWSAEAAEQHARIAADFDVVLVDAPPAGELGPVLELVRPAQVVLVVADGEDIAAVRETARVLRVIGVSVVGYVYNHVPRRWAGPRRQSLPLPARRRRQISGRAAPALPATESYTSSAGTG